jgi:hypothetical protein
MSRGQGRSSPARDAEEAGEEGTASGTDAMGPDQRRVLRRAVRLERTTVGFQIVAIALVAVVAGQSQAMRVAWIEDSLSLLPPLAFLLAARRIRRAPDRDHPYGHHRSIGVAHRSPGSRWPRWEPSWRSIPPPR